MDLSSFQIIDINLISIIVLAIILIASSGFREKRMIQYKLFDTLLILGILLNLLEVLGWIFDARFGMTGELARVMNLTFNTLLYCTVPMPGAIWLLYTQHQVFHSMDLFRKTASLLGPLLLLNAFISILSIKTGWFFSVDQNNFYYRGDYFPLHVVIVYGFLVSACLLVIIKRDLLDPLNFRALLLYVVPLIIGSVLQVAVHGINFNWPFYTLSLLIVFVHIQNRGQYTDSLTGTYNRTHFERILRIRINRTDANDRFALIIADIENLYDINSQMGRQVGDEVLRSTADRLRRSLRKEDLIARVGGHEFYILVEITDEKALEKAVGRLYKAFENNRNTDEIDIGVCLCGKIYDRSDKQSTKLFLGELDSLLEQERTRRLQSI